MNDITISLLKTAFIMYRSDVTIASWYMIDKLIEYLFLVNEISSTQCVMLHDITKNIYYK